MSQERRASLPCRNNLAGQQDPGSDFAPAGTLAHCPAVIYPLPRGQVGLKAIPSCASHLANGVGRNPDGAGVCSLGKAALQHQHQQGSL